MQANYTDISIKRIESRTFFVMGNQSIEVKDYKIISSGNGDAELTLVLKGKDVYEQINVKYIPFEQNKQLQQITDAIIEQSLSDMENITRSMGFYLDYGGKKVLTPLSQVYADYLDSACMDIVSGAFDYNSVLRRTVTQLTNSGLRKIDYASGRADRVDVAARRAVMTGVAKLTHKITEYHMEQLGCEYVEVSWHVERDLHILCGREKFTNGINNT